MTREELEKKRDEECFDTNEAIGWDRCADLLIPELEMAQHNYAGSEIDRKHFEEECKSLRSQLAQSQAAVAEIYKSFKSHLAVMEDINICTGYQFTQPLIIAHEALAKHAPKSAEVK